MGRHRGGRRLDPGPARRSLLKRSERSREHAELRHAGREERREERRARRELRGEAHDPRRIVGEEVAIVVGLRLPHVSRADAEESLEELASLTRASGARVVGSELQSRSRVDGRTFIGAGKAAELKDEAARLGANLVVIDHDLSPAQARNLEKIADLKILDRTELILDIFARRARTPQAKLQVEVAQLEYLLPRLTRLWEHLSRTGGGIGTRGPGETQLEVDRRRIRDRLSRLKRKLRGIDRRLAVQRDLHPDVFRVSLVGYTNTGKSSLMNRLTTAEVSSRDRLFETLDATTRILALGPGFRATLTDTVGFVRRLPHALVESFRATLAEVAQSDLLLHVVDASSPQAEARSASVESVLREIGADDVPLVTVWNKADLLSPAELDGLRRRLGPDPWSVVTSATTGDGLEELREAVRTPLRRGWFEVGGLVPAGEGELLSRLRLHTEILEEIPDGASVRLRLRSAPGVWGRLRARWADRAPSLFGSG